MGWLMLCLLKLARALSYQLYGENGSTIDKGYCVKSSGPFRTGMQLYT